VSYILLGILGLCCGAVVAYLLSPQNERPVVHVNVPGDGEHFVVRVGATTNEYILDVFNSAGTLVKTAGTLRPGSVARAAVLPPYLGASLGAKNAFDRFELDENGQFTSTEKAEGYQVFPFVTVGT
jgi:hypothetical protein